MAQQTTTAPRVKIAQPVATVENTTGEGMRQRVAEWQRLKAEQAADGYHWTVAYRGIVTFTKPRHPDRHFTSNLALQMVPCDLWGYALTD